MAISSIGASASLNFSPPAGPSKEVRDGMKALQEALSSGDGDAANDAYDSLMSALEEETSTGTTDQRKQKLMDILAKVGEALESGNLESAKEAFAANAPKGPPPGAASGSPPGPKPSEEVMNGMASLAEALQSGDEDSAKSAYEQLMKALSEGSTAESDPMKETFLSVLSDVGTALEGGNMSSAQDLFALLIPRGSQGVDMVA